jgi:hypothetical protein
MASPIANARCEGSARIPPRAKNMFCTTYAPSSANRQSPMMTDQGTTHGQPTRTQQIHTFTNRCWGKFRCEWQLSHLCRSGCAARRHGINTARARAMNTHPESTLHDRTLHFRHVADDAWIITCRVECHEARSQWNYRAAMSARHEMLSKGCRRALQWPAERYTSEHGMHP